MPINESLMGARGVLHLKPSPLPTPHLYLDHPSTPLMIPSCLVLSPPQCPFILRCSQPSFKSFLLSPASCISANTSLIPWRSPVSFSSLLCPFLPFLFPLHHSHTTPRSSGTVNPSLPSSPRVFSPPRPLFTHTPLFYITPFSSVISCPALNRSPLLCSFVSPHWFPFPPLSPHLHHIFTLFLLFVNVFPSSVHRLSCLPPSPSFSLLSPLLSPP